MRLLVVGAGAMGRWFARTVDADVAFADVDPAAAKSAAAALDGRVVPPDTDETFDAVCVAVPMSIVSAAIADYAPLAEQALLDLSGVMAEPVEAMREHAPDRERASLHPLFAPENAPGNLPVVTDERGAVVDDLLADLEAAGNNVFDTTPAEHDKAMETVQARTHAAVLSYALAADDVREEFHTPISAELQGLVDTVTDGTPQVYREIQEAFEGAGDVAEEARKLADAEGEAFDELYQQAGESATADSDAGESASEDGERGGDRP